MTHLENAIPSPAAGDNAAIHQTFAILLAGGKGSGLADLTAFESKPAVHFAGDNRIVDFVMANVVRSGLPQLLVATQYAPGTLHDHLPAIWGAHLTGRRFGQGLVLADGQGHYSGTADAIRQNWGLIARRGIRHLLVLSADQIYQADYNDLLTAHRDSGAAVTHVVAGGGQGDPVRRVGVYVFDVDWLGAVLSNPAVLDIAADVIPLAIGQGVAAAWPLPVTGGRAGYWRDIGTIDALRLAHLDFLDDPPIRLPFPGPVSDWHLGRESVRLRGAVVPTTARLTRALVAPDVVIPPGLVVGEDAAEDSRWFCRSEAGTVLITQAMLDRREALRGSAVRSVAMPLPVEDDLAGDPLRWLA